MSQNNSSWRNGKDRQDRTDRPWLFIAAIVLLWVIALYSVFSGW